MLVTVLEAVCYGGALALELFISLANLFLNVHRVYGRTAWNKTDLSPALVESTAWECVQGQEAVKQTKRGVSVAKDHMWDLVQQ